MGKLLSKLGRIRLLPPKDKHFYQIFNQMTEVLVEASDLVMNLVRDHQADSGQSLAQRLKRMETECDGLVSRTITLLDESPQPPFDRDDITHLMKVLDDVMDWMERFASRFVIYQLSVNNEASHERLIQLADIVQASCRQLREAVSRLPRNRDVEDLCIAIHGLEAQADEIHHGSLSVGVSRIHEQQISIETDLADLLEAIKKGDDAVSPEQMAGGVSRLILVAQANRQLTLRVFDFIILQEVYKALEQASDASVDVAITIRRMVMKNV